MLSAVRKNGRMVSAETEASSSTKAEKSIAVMLRPLTGAQWNYPRDARPATSRARAGRRCPACDPPNRCVRHGAPAGVMSTDPEGAPCGLCHCYEDSRGG